MGGSKSAVMEWPVTTLPVVSLDGFCERWHCCQPHLCLFSVLTHHSWHCLRWRHYCYHLLRFSRISWFLTLHLNMPKQQIIAHLYLALIVTTVFVLTTHLLTMKSRLIKVELVQTQQDLWVYMFHTRSAYFGSVGFSKPVYIKHLAAL